MSEEQIATLFGEISPAKKDEEEPKFVFDVWKFVNDISEKKEYLYSDETKSFYNAWIVNKHFAAFPDTLYHVAFLNENYHLDSDMQHDYLFHSIPKKRGRRSAWLKKTDSEKKQAALILDIARARKCNIKQASIFWGLLSETQKIEYLSKIVYPDAKNGKNK